MFPVDLIRHDNPELFIAIVAPVGADTERVCDSLRESLLRFSYKLKIIRVVEELKQFAGYLDDEPAEAYARFKGRMDAGDRFRSDSKRNDALALLSLAEVRRHRGKGGSPEKPILRQAYLFSFPKTSRRSDGA